jgi:UDP-3-O-[3-hydroxymyristoyl] N-acetylglucosamine deacetylase
MVVEGRGLHSGAHARVTLARRDGPVTLNGTAVADLRVVGKDRATTVAEPRVATVEHLFAALAGLGVREGIAIAVDGPELPLLDGGAAKWCEVIAGFGIVLRRAGLRVARSGTVEIGRSRYVFEVEVEVEKTAKWSGDAMDFAARIAPARTFAFAHEVAELASRGLASHVDPESVVVLAPDVVHSAGRAFSSDEPARHKLLDLIGDLYLYGGPPIGRVRAFRPGHGATHAAVARALALGILARS